MVVLTAQEMQKIDQMAIDDLEIPSLVLMENAGVAIVNRILNRYGDLVDKRILILVGKGNNGGDGLVIARHLLNHDVKVKVYLLESEQDLSPDCKHNLGIFRKLQGEIHQITKQSLNKLKINLTLTDLVIDALVGTGFQGEPRGILGDVIRLVNNCRTPVISVDLPSGVNGTTGEVSGNAVRAEFTPTLGFLKTGLLLYPGAEHCGIIEVADIGIPKSLATGIKRYQTNDQIHRFLPQRPAWSHKGTYGHCLVIAGSRSMTGAAYLASYAALRSGAGLVTLAVPESIASEFPPGEVMVKSIPETGNGQLGLASKDTLLALIEDKSALIIGPGLGENPEIQSLIMELMQRWDRPLIVDADGLNNMKDLTWLRAIPESTRRKWIFTPHPGEMGRLFNRNSADVNADRLNMAWDAWQQLGINFVLKGAPTIIAGDNQLYINSTGNSGMSTAGMGDVLSGIIGGLMSQGLNGHLAGVVGVYFHGKAGDMLVEKYGNRGLIASDILPVLSQLIS